MIGGKPCTETEGYPDEKRKNSLSGTPYAISNRGIMLFLAREFAEELEKYGRLYVSIRPDYEMYAHNIYDYPHKCLQAVAIMLMINNNLDKAVAQHPMS